MLYKCEKWGLNAEREYYVNKRYRVEFTNNSTLLYISVL